MHRPILPILVSYLIGLTWGYYFSVPFHILIALLFISSSFTAASILTKKSPQLFFVFAMASIFILGMARINAVLAPFLPEEHIVNNISDGPVSLEGRICGPPERFLDKTRLYIDLSTLYLDGAANPVKGRLQLSIGRKDGSDAGSKDEFKYGDTVRFNAKVRKPRNFHNPGGFDYEKYLALKGIYATAYVRDGDGIVKTGVGVWSVNRWIEEIRGSIRKSVYKNAGDTAPVLLALITGEQGEIPGGIREDFSRAGTAHILAISGEHSPLINCAVMDTNV